MHTLEIRDLHAEKNGTKILNGLSLTVKSAEIHAIMGQNGCGKSTLCRIIMGDPTFEVTKGQILFDNKEIGDLPTNERANLGLFLGFQQPLEIPGVALGNFLRLALNANRKAQKEESLAPREFLPLIRQASENLKMDSQFVSRSLNEGFSGGEKKRAEIVQMQILQPKIALLDEIDSGLDIDSLKIVAAGINETYQQSQLGLLLITHYPRLLKYIAPHHVHIMSQGRIIKSGTIELAHELEEKGYEHFLS